MLAPAGSCSWVTEPVLRCCALQTGGGPVVSHCWLTLLLRHRLLISASWPLGIDGKSYQLEELARKTYPVLHAGNRLEAVDWLQSAHMGACLLLCMHVSVLNYDGRRLTVSISGITGNPYQERAVTSQPLNLTSAAGGNRHQQTRRTRPWPIQMCTEETLACGERSDNVLWSVIVIIPLSCTHSISFALT